MSTDNTQQLLVFQSLWAMERRHSDGFERSLEENVGMIAEAGFEGVSAHWTDRAAVARLAELLRPLGLTAEGQCFPKSVDDLKPVLELATEFPVHHICLQPDVRPRRLEDCLPLLEGWMRLAEQVDVPVYVETHRDRMTTDLLLHARHPRRHARSAAARRRLALSGRARVRGPGLRREPRAHPSAFWTHSWAFHGRVASREQVQIEISFPPHRMWVDLFERWWSYGFASWRRRSALDATLAFTCELGPKPYAIIGRDGNDTTDRWLESLQLRDLGPQHLGRNRSWNSRRTTMKTRAAVAFEAGKPLEIVDVDLDGPKEGEVMVEIKATGICHTDEFTRSGADPEGLFPSILGHEGAGVVVETGPGVKSLKKGDHVIPLYTPECRECPSCLSRKTNLCTAIRATQGQGLMPDGTSRFSYKGKPILHYMGCSTFSNYTVLPEIAVAKSPGGRALRQDLLHRLRRDDGRRRRHQHGEGRDRLDGGGLRPRRHRPQRHPRAGARRRRHDHRRRPQQRQEGVGRTLRDDALRQPQGDRRRRRPATSST